jgi:radical SAM protein with 4Fe4S-binding SPASM domain
MRFMESVFEVQTKLGRLKEAGKFPKVVLIDTISYCDLKCTMCVHKEMKRKRGRMPWNLYTKIIDEIALVDKATRVWMVFFGEALILKRRKPSIFDMISYAKGKGLKDVVLNSNANLLDKEAASRIIKSGLDGIYIGIDAFSPETYMKIRVGGSYAKAVNNTLYLLELKKELGSKKPEVFVQFVEMDVNMAEKEDFIEFWRKAGAGVKIRPKVSWAGQIEAPNLTMGDKDRWPCYWAMRTLSITDTGKVVTCAVDLDARFVAGDVNHQSIREIWNGKLKELRQLHQSRQFEALPENCKQCKDWQAARADYYWMNP